MGTVAAPAVGGIAMQENDLLKRHASPHLIGNVDRSLRLGVRREAVALHLSCAPVHKPEDADPCGARFDVGVRQDDGVARAHVY